MLKTINTLLISVFLISCASPSQNRSNKTVIKEKFTVNEVGEGVYRFERTNYTLGSKQRAEQFLKLKAIELCTPLAYSIKSKDYTTSYFSFTDPKLNVKKLNNSKGLIACDKDEENASIAIVATIKELYLNPTLTKIEESILAIHSGKFYMGCQTKDADCEEFEYPRHERNVKQFKLMKHELTWEMYKPCIDSGACPALADGIDYGNNHPVVNVSWNMINEHYLPWLNQGSQYNYRLPSEVEWEYAARAGSKSKYSWGDMESGKYANASEKHGWPHDGFLNTVAPSMSLQPNTFGLYDMYGNVWEWTQDCWNEDEYKNELKTSSANESRGEKYESSSICKRRSVRGGAFGNNAEFLRASKRYRIFANSRFSNIGFRLARD